MSFPSRRTTFGIRPCQEIGFLVMSLLPLRTFFDRGEVVNLMKRRGDFAIDVFKVHIGRRLEEPEPDLDENESKRMRQKKKGRR